MVLKLGGCQVGFPTDLAHEPLFSLVNVVDVFLQVILVVEHFPTGYTLEVLHVGVTLSVLIKTSTCTEMFATYITNMCFILRIYVEVPFMLPEHVVGT